MYRKFIEIMSRSDCLAGSKVVAAAADKETIEAVKLAVKRGLGHAILIGDSDLIMRETEKAGIVDKVEVIHAETPSAAAALAVRSIREGKGDALLKGLINTADFLKAILDKDNGLRTGRLLSHLAIMEIPGEDRLSFCTDSGFNVAPDLDQKKRILRNALEAISALGYAHVNAACLSANEKVDPKMPSTVDAAAIAKAWADGEFNDLRCTCIIEGPIALDVVASAEHAKHKGIKSRIAGDVDLTLVPNIECGNVHCKTLVHYCNAQMAGLVLGAKAPIVLVSRSDPPESKFLSMALACIISGGMG